ncbi:hypothetical protein QQ045_003536 [Rhodiola kirilowii]
MEDETRAALLSKLKPGDHIASERLGDQFEHHGIYMGLVNGFLHKVTHFKAPIKDSKISGGQGHSVVEKCPVCDYKPPQDGGQVNSCLDCFCKGEKIYIIRYKVPLPYSPDGEDLKSGKILRGYRNDELYLELYKGTELFGHMNIPSESEDNKNKDVDIHILLSKYISCRTPEQVLEAAQSNHNMGKYSFLFNNCEDFAVHCMVGKERSIQAENKLHKVPYKVGKKFHLLTDGHKMKEKIKDKALRCFPHMTS